MNKTVLITLGLLIFASVAFVYYKVKQTYDVCNSLKDKKVLVVYFSRAGDNYIVGKVDKGNTAFIAEYIAEMTDADICEVKGEKDYEAMSYKEMLDMVREEGENKEFPGFKTNLGDVSNYDVVFIGGPIWWGTYPRAMFSFFKEYDFNGKIIIPFTTNEGSGLGDTMTDLQEYYPDAKILLGFTITGQEARKPQAKDAVYDWLSTLQINNDNIVTMAVDGTTGATTMKSPLTEEGLAIEHHVTENVVVTYENGKTENISMVVNGAVDMGDGLMWAVTNIGAFKPWDVGSHFAWGESKPKISYTEENYEHLDRNIGKDISGTWYDAVRRIYGGDWRMPTYQEWNRLLNNTASARVSISGVPGYLFTAKNGNHIFLPGNGYIYGKETGSPKEGFYWSSTNANPINSYVTYLPENSWGQSNYGRHIGLGLRAVMPVHP